MSHGADTRDARYGARTIWAVVVPLLVLALSPGAAAAPTQGPDVPAGELVQQTVANEVAAANTGGHYMYRLTKVTPGGSETQAIIETRDWAIGRLIQVDGSPLTPERQRKEITRLDTLRKDPRRVSALKEELHHDEQRVRRIMRALPDASEYTYFGWGILGRLHRGGHFLLEQRDVGAGRWAITIRQLDFTGRVLLLKPITIASLSRATDFRRMPDDLTLEQGLARLLAEGQTTSSR